MNKIDKKADRASAALPVGRRFGQTLGARLLLLLLVAEAPLVLFTCAQALQNDRLRATDALTRTQALQDQTLSQLGRDLHTAVSLAVVAANLPRALLTNGTECGAVLRLLVAANPDRIKSVSVIDTDRHVVCTSALQSLPQPVQALVAASAGQPRPYRTLADTSGIYLLHPIATASPLAGAAVIALAALPGLATQRAAAVPAPCLWLGQPGRWQALNCADRAALPAVGRDPAGAATAVRDRSAVGAPFLYTSADLPGQLAAGGDRLLAGSDIRAASRASARRIGVRVAEISFLFIAEFVLIIAGVSVVASGPLKRLNAAVQRWRQSGRFEAGEITTDPRELRDLAGSFSDATASLSLREQELRRSVAQQDALMKEIHHRVKNNLQIIASLLNLQASRIKVPEARAEFQSARDRVRALATLHRHLYPDGELHAINMRDFFAELCSQLFQSGGEAEGDRINSVIVAPDVRLSSDQAVPIALIVTEAVANALKYAFPGDRRGTITVRLDVAAEQQATLIVSDDGVGLADRPDSSEAGSAGLGLLLVRGFARQLGGRLSVSGDGGTCYRIDMTLRLHRFEDQPDAAVRDPVPV